MTSFRQTARQRGGSSGGTRPKVFVHCDGAEWLVKFRDSSLSVNGNYKNPGKEDAVQLAEKFGLRKDEAEEVYEEINKHIK